MLKGNSADDNEMFTVYGNDAKSVQIFGSGLWELRAGNFNLVNEERCPITRNRSNQSHG